MINALLPLLLSQLAGEAAARALGLPVPGPVLGMLILLTAFALFPALITTVRPVAQALLANLSLLFVPAGVGIVGHISTLDTQGPAILLALLVSTALAIVAAAFTFTLVARLTGNPPPPEALK